MTLTTRPLLIGGLILLALPSCAGSSPALGRADSAQAIGVDLGASSRIPVIPVAMTSAGQDMRGMASGAAPAGIEPIHDGKNDAHTTGTVNAVDTDQRKLNLSHAPIPALGWPAMTMDFAVAPSVDLSRIKPGSRVQFSLEKGKNGMYEVQSVQPAGAAR